MSAGLNEALTVLLDWEDEEVDYITVEVTVPESTPSVPSVLALNGFLEERPEASAIRDILEKLALQYARSKDPNDYFSAYTRVLCDTEGIPPQTVLDWLQTFFVRISSLMNPSKKTQTEQPQTLLSLEKEDSDILEYIGGFLARRIFYRQGTTADEKRVLTSLKREVRSGSIAYHRDRPSQQQHSGARLWGISSAFTVMVEEAEIYFRRHSVECPGLDITDQFYHNFFKQSNVSRALNALDIDYDAGWSVIVKIFMLFVKLRSKSYAIKHSLKLETKPAPKRALRQELKRARQPTTKE